MALTALTETAFPAMMKLLMDRGFAAESRFKLWWVPASVVLLFGLRGIAAFISNYTMQWISNNVLRDIRLAMFDKLLLMPAISFDSKSAGVLLSRLISDTQMVLYAATSVLTVMVKDTLTLIGLLIWLSWLNWKLTLIVLAVMPLLALLTYKFSVRMRGVSKRYLNTVGEMTGVVEEVIAGNRVIKLQGAQTYERRRFAAVTALQRAQSMKYAVAASLHSPVGQLIAALGLAVVLTVSLHQARNGAATVGDFVSFITAMLMMLAPLKHLADVNAQLQRGLAAAENIFEVLDEKSEKDNGTLDTKRVVGTIEFKDVTLRYPTRKTPALDAVSLSLDAGKTYALVGPSGGGKTTLVSALPRLYEIESGCIEIDGVDIRNYRLTSLRAQIALVSQDVILFNDTIEKNITYGKADVSKQELMNAIVSADLDAFIKSLPSGMDTELGDRGVRISGGQRQRIAIARAILKNAPILILDEATSALDTRTEANVQRAIDQLRINRTTLVIAHRLSTVVGADRIVVLDKGKIVEQGTHAQLIERSGLYQQLYSTFEKK